DDAAELLQPTNAILLPSGEICGGPFLPAISGKTPAGGTIESISGDPGPLRVAYLVIARVNPAAANATGRAQISHWRHCFTDDAVAVGWCAASAIQLISSLTSEAD